MISVISRKRQKCIHEHKSANIAIIFLHSDIQCKQSNDPSIRSFSSQNPNQTLKKENSISTAIHCFVLMIHIRLNLPGCFGPVDHENLGKIKNLRIKILKLRI